MNQIAKKKEIYFIDRGRLNAFDQIEENLAGALTNPSPLATYNNEGPFQRKPPAFITAGMVIIFPIALSARTVLAPTGVDYELPA